MPIPTHWPNFPGPKYPHYDGCDGCEHTWARSPLGVDKKKFVCVGCPVYLKYATPAQNSTWARCLLFQRVANEYERTGILVPIDCQDHTRCEKGCTHFEPETPRTREYRKGRSREDREDDRKIYMAAYMQRPDQKKKQRIRARRRREAIKKGAWKFTRALAAFVSPEEAHEIEKRTKREWWHRFGKYRRRQKREDSKQK